MIEKTEENTMERRAICMQELFSWSQGEEE